MRVSWRQKHSTWSHNFFRFSLYMCFLFLRFVVFRLIVISFILFVDLKRNNHKNKVQMNFLHYIYCANMHTAVTQNNTNWRLTLIMFIFFSSFYLFFSLHFIFVVFHFCYASVLNFLQFSFFNIRVFVCLYYIMCLSIWKACVVYELYMRVLCIVIVTDTELSSKIMQWQQQQ